MTDFIKNFARDEDGAVTVDWVVLTAAIVGLGIAVMNQVGTATDDLAGKIEAELDATSVKTY